MARISIGREMVEVPTISRGQLWDALDFIAALYVGGHEDLLYEMEHYFSIDEVAGFVSYFARVHDMDVRKTPVEPVVNYSERRR